jgi:hypothetical protein
MTWSSSTGRRPLPLLLTLVFLIAACGQPSQPAATAEPTATALPAMDIDMELPEGDVTRGFPTAVRNRCQPCHANPDYPTFGPRFESSDGLPSISERAEVRIADPDYDGGAATNWEYIIEAILLPEAYIVPGDWEEAMPTYYGDRIEDQDPADIIAWMATID